MSKGDPTHRQILRLLKEQSGSYLPGTMLASRLGLTRTGIWKHIQNLRVLGYDIQSHPKEGYRLVGVPDLLIPEEIVPHLDTAWAGKSYHHFAQTGSTNDRALHLALQGAPHGTVVVAEEQTQGRGRLNRTWVSSPRSGITMSLLLRTPLPVRDAPQTTLVATLAFIKVLRERYEVPAAIKWPNDILVQGKKLAGILTEMQSDQDRVRFIVIGIGMNVNQSERELEGPFRYPATSLAMELGAKVRRQDLLVAFLHQFEREYDRFLERGFASLLPELEEASAILGKTITIHCGKEELSGKALGFTPEGALTLLTKEGREEVIWVGDVTRVEGTV